MKVLIAGYYGFGNLGDELILSTIVSQLKSRYGQVDVTVLSNAPEETQRNHEVHAVSRWNVFSLISQIWRNDFLILGGGGLLQNKTSQRSILYYLGLVGLARLLQSPVILYAMGVETLQGNFTRKLTRFLLASPLVTVTVRDEASKNILADIGLRDASIHLTADPVFSRKTEVAAHERYTGFSGSALLIPRFPCPASGRTLFAILARILRDEKKMKVNGVLFEPSTETSFLQKFNGEPILSEDDFLSELSVETLATRVSDYDWVVSARFHGLVLAALAGRSFIGVGDPHKVGRICELLKMPFLPWDATEADIIRAVETMLRKNLKGALPEVEKLRDASLQTVQLIK